MLLDAETRRNTRGTSSPDWFPCLQGYAGKSKPASAETAEIVRLRSGQTLIALMIARKFRSRHVLRVFLRASVPPRQEASPHSLQSRPGRNRRRPASVLGTQRRKVKTCERGDSGDPTASQRGARDSGRPP